MSDRPRDYQAEHERAVTEALWAPGVTDVMGTMPTGAGKTFTFCRILRNHDLPSCVTAHRHELMSQIALALNREEVPHAIIAPPPKIREIVAAQVKWHGRTFYKPRSHIRVASVDTLNTNRTRTEEERWLKQVRLSVWDEGHHVLRANKWGKARMSMPNAHAFYATAHALRGDRKGLGRQAEGFVDRLILGPHMRGLTLRGFLTGYRWLAPQSSVDMAGVTLSADGDYNQAQLSVAVRKSQVTGDMVRVYLEKTPGTLAIAFTVDLALANEAAQKFNAAGVPAAVISGNTPLGVRIELMARFRARQILVLLSVDVLGEGVDVPGVETVILGRPTESFQLFAQQVGRCVRVIVDDHLKNQWDTFTDSERLYHIQHSRKPRGTVIDLVDNWLRHSMPDAPRIYNLGKPIKGEGELLEDDIPQRRCTACFELYPRRLKACEHCGTVPKVIPRGTPAQVDGDITEIDEELLRKLRGEAARILEPEPAIPYGADARVAASVRKRWLHRREAQLQLRDVISVWAGWKKQGGWDDRDIYVLFYSRFRMDIMTAQTLAAREAADLWALVMSDLIMHNVRGAHA